LTAVITPEHPASPDAVSAVPFFVIRADGAPAGGGGIKLFGAEYGEIKGFEAWVSAGGLFNERRAAYFGLVGRPRSHSAMTTRLPSGSATMLS